MPRYPQRKFDALELLDRLKRGPASMEDGTLTPEKYKLWLESWITPQVIALIPELLKLKEQNKI